MTLDELLDDMVADGSPGGGVGFEAGVAAAVAAGGTPGGGGSAAGLDGRRTASVQSARQPVGQGDQGIRSKPRVTELPGEMRADKFALDIEAGDS